MRFVFFCSLMSVLSAGEHWIIDGKGFSKLGFFAAANQVLGQLAIFESDQPVKVDGLRIDFGLLGLYYDSMYGSNWWSYYFEPISLGDWGEQRGVYPSKDIYYEAFKKRKQLTRAQAGELVQKYIRVRPHILEEVGRFVSLHFADFFVIGVHYRGTDKSLEAPRISYDQVFEEIFKHLPIDKQWRVFAATDEQPFLEELRRVFPGKIIACEAHRSKNGKPIHLFSKTPYQIGKEALMDALVLAECDLLIRTSSNLSLWATYFNPSLPTVLLSQNYRSWQNAMPE